MTNPRPESVATYLTWCQDVLHIDWLARRTWYTVNAQAGLTLLNGDSPGLSAFRNAARTTCNEFQARTGLAGTDSDPETFVLLIKSFESVVEKTFRMNVLMNKSWPDAPRSGWITPENVFSLVNDIFRGQFVCNYLDLAEGIARTGAEQLIAAGVGGAHASPQGRESGYHAYHLNFQVNIPFIPAGGQGDETAVNIEIQLRTKLQSVLYELTHLVYEQSRLNTGRAGQAWKWDVTEPNYKSAYLGHTLHLIEGVVIELREALLTKRSADTEPTAGAESGESNIAAPVAPDQKG